MADMVTPNRTTTRRRCAIRKAWPAAPKSLDARNAGDVLEEIGKEILPQLAALQP